LGQQGTDVFYHGVLDLPDSYRNGFHWVWFHKETIAEKRKK